MALVQHTSHSQKALFLPSTVPDIDVPRYLKSQSATNFHEKMAKNPAVLKSQHLQSLFTYHQSAWVRKRQKFAKSHKPTNSVHTLQVRGRFLPVGTKQGAEGAQAGHGNKQTPITQEPGTAQGSSVWNMLNRRLQSCHTLAKFHCYFKRRSVYTPYRIYRAF